MVNPVASGTERRLGLQSMQLLILITVFIFAQPAFLSVSPECLLLSRQAWGCDGQSLVYLTYLHILPFLACGAIPLRLFRSWKLGARISPLGVVHHEHYQCARGLSVIFIPLVGCTECCLPSFHMHDCLCLSSLPICCQNLRHLVRRKMNLQFQNGKIWKIL